MIKELKLTNVGPAPTMELAFGQRLNLLTGDNNLGKKLLPRQKGESAIGA